MHGGLGSQWNLFLTSPILLAHRPRDQVSSTALSARQDCPVQGSKKRQKTNKKNAQAEPAKARPHAWPVRSIRAWLLL